MKEEFFGYSLLLIVRKKRDKGLFSRIIWCLFFIGRVSIILMIVCIPCFGMHSWGGQRLIGERMEESNWKASGIHSQRSQR